MGQTDRSSTTVFQVKLPFESGASGVAYNKVGAPHCGGGARLARVAALPVPIKSIADKTIIMTVPGPVNRAELYAMLFIGFVTA